MSAQCKKRIYSEFGGSYPCPHPAKTPLGYCGVHDPQEKERRRLARGPSKLDRELERMRAQRAVEREIREFLAASGDERAKTMLLLWEGGT